MYKLTDLRNVNLGISPYSRNHNILKTGVILRESIAKTGEAIYIVKLVNVGQAYTGLVKALAELNDGGGFEKIVLRTSVKKFKKDHLEMAEKNLATGWKHPIQTQAAA